MKTTRKPDNNTARRIGTKGEEFSTRIPGTFGPYTETYLQVTEKDEVKRKELSTHDTFSISPLYRPSGSMC